MSDEEVPDSAEERPVFPYHVLWPGYGNAFVDLREPLDQADEYRIFADPALQAWHEVRFVTEDEVAKVLAQHGIGSDHTLAFWVIACFYLTPRQIEAFGVNPKRSRQKLLRAAYHASKLTHYLG